MMNDSHSESPHKLAVSVGNGVTYDLCEAGGCPFVVIWWEKDFGTRKEPEFMGCNDPAFPALLQDIRATGVKHDTSPPEGYPDAGDATLTMPGADIMDVWRELIDSAV